MLSIAIHRLFNPSAAAPGVAPAANGGRELHSLGNIIAATYAG